LIVEWLLSDFAQVLLSGLILSVLWKSGIILFVGSLRYWYQRNKVDHLVSNSAVWNDDAVQGALDCAAFWVKDLPFVQSLSGLWKFFLAPDPTSVPNKFYGTAFEDSEWETLPGNIH
jgi:hypothetical protein